MITSRIWRKHVKASGQRKGSTELFVVEPRKADGAYLVRKRGVKGNRDDCYDAVHTLDEVWSHLQDGRAVRMKGQVSGEWNTLSGEGVQRA